MSGSGGDQAGCASFLIPTSAMEVKGRQRRCFASTKDPAPATKFVASPSSDFYFPPVAPFERRPYVADKMNLMTGLGERDLQIFCDLFSSYIFCDLELRQMKRDQRSYLCLLCLSPSCSLAYFPRNTFLMRLLNLFLDLGSEVSSGEGSSMG